MLTILYPIALLQAVAAPESAPESVPATPPPAPAPCSSEVHAAFDFWIGEWDVFVTGSDRKVGENVIERISGGCVIRESWSALGGGDGTSMSFINHRSGRWEQLWMGNDGRRVDFIGGTVGPRIVLTGYWDDIGGPGRDGLIRMTFTPQPDGSVRQFGEASGDHGLDWVTSFDYTYRRKVSVSSGE